jgi:HAD superfamily hydrolase (TIGR01509 family)
MGASHPQLDLVIFDCDGVLVDSEVLSCQCLSDVLGDCGIELSKDRALELFLGRSTAAILHHYRQDRRLDPESFPAELKARVLQRFRDELQPIAGVAALVSDLRTPCCVASSSDLDRVSLSLALTGLAPHFDGRLYTAQMVPRGKPAPDLLLYAAAQMRAAPAHTLVVEDSVSGVAAAKAAGMTVGGFVGGSHYRSRDGHSMLYDAGADRVFDRMADFWSER